MKKKVLVFNLTPRSGMLHYSSQFCNELSHRKDIELKVAIASYHTSKLYDSRIEFIKIQTTPSIGSFFFESLNIFSHVAFLLRIKKFSPDIVHFIDNHPWYSFYVRIFAFLGYSVYTTQHDPTLHSGETKTLVGKIAVYTNHVLRKYSDLLIVHGDTLKKELTEKYTISPEKVISIPHGAYTFFNSFSQNLPVQKNTFLFFGRILEYKGLDILLDSLGEVKKTIPDFHLIIAGPGDISSYEKKIEIYTENISLYNFEIEAEDAYTYFEVSEFVVLPYKDATGSGVIPVAYCFRKPVLVTDVGELSSVVDTGQTGIVIPVSDSKILAETIIKLLRNKEKTKEMGGNGYKYSLEELSWKPIIEKIYC